MISASVSFGHSVKVSLIVSQFSYHGQIGFCSRDAVSVYQPRVLYRRERFSVACYFRMNFRRCKVIQSLLGVLPRSSNASLDSWGVVCVCVFV